MQARFIERSTGMAREKRSLESSSGDEGQPDSKRPALARYLILLCCLSYNLLYCDC